MGQSTKREIHETMETTTDNIHKQKKTTATKVACKEAEKEEKTRRTIQENDQGKKTTRTTERFQAFFKSIVPIIAELWKERCVDRTTLVIGGRIAAEYDSISKQISHLYTLKEMVLPEDELKIFNEPINVRLVETNQQMKKWINRWKTVIDHSMISKSEGTSKRQQQAHMETFHS